jgi:thrombospondin type 3 repeat protein
MTRRLITLAACATALLALPAGASAKTHDRNHDGLPDRWEHAHHLSLHVNQARRDQDHDGLSNRREFRFGTNPRRADSDGDGLRDGMEIETANNPRDRDSNDDGIRDGAENAGTVVSFTNNVLTIRSGGQDVGAPVTSETRIECEGRNDSSDSSDSSGDATARMADHGDDGGDQGDHHGDRGGPGSGDRSGSGDDGNDNESGDDNGANCTAADLQPGAVVNEAELEATASGYVWREVKLVR